MFKKLSNIVNKATDVADKISHSFNKALVSLAEEKNYSNGVYKGDLVKQESYPYEMIRHGLGEMKYNNGHIYIGNWENDKKIKGKYIFPSGVVYDGTIQNDNPTGKGKISYPTGFYYIGFVINGNYDGYGTMYNQNGEIVCEGNWKEDEFIDTIKERTITYNGGSYRGFLKAKIYLPHGKGMLSYTNGDTYEGDWKEGKKDGKGIMIFVNQDRYDGEWKDDKRNGKGTFLDNNGDLFEGVWANDEFISIVKETTIDYDGYKYTGFLFNNVPNGKGKITYNNGEYVGDWKDGKRTGKGIYSWLDGGLFEGEWKDNKRVGNGKLTWEDGDIYEGDWKDDKRTGKGKYIWKDGNVYEGEWKDNKKSGQGILKDANGSIIDQGVWEDDECVSPIDEKTIEYDGGIYTGMIVNKLPEGNGLIICKNGWKYKYEGEWKKGKQHGKGKFTEDDGTIYEGEFKDGLYHGIGKITRSNGDVYEGEYLAGGRNGFGKEICANGDVYEGSWLDSNKNGNGKSVYVDGRIYKGEFEDDEESGQGVLTYKNGDTYMGSFANGKKYCKGVLTDKTGQILEANFWVDDVCIDSLAKKHLLVGNYAEATKQYNTLLKDAAFTKYKSEINVLIENIKQLELKSLISNGFGTYIPKKNVTDLNSIGDDFDDFA